MISYSTGFSKPSTATVISSTVGAPATSIASACQKNESITAPNLESTTQSHAYQSTSAMSCQPPAGQNAKFGIYFSQYIVSEVHPGCEDREWEHSPPGAVQMAVECFMSMHSLYLSIWQSSCCPSLSVVGSKQV